jgi:hypothetical protein
MSGVRLSFVISFVLLLSLTIGVVNATYTDYIGAGHDTGVTVTACGVDEEAIGQKTVDGSGLSGGNHSADWIDHWLTYDSSTNPNPTRSSYDYWIKYDFGETYSLADMWVWNYNEITNRGLNHVYIDYSTDGSSWSQLGSSTFQFPEASGSSSYPGFAGPDFAGATARYVLISVVDHWGGDSYGLAEVKFNLGSGGGTVGNTSVFGNSVGASTRRAMPFTMPENGTIQSVSMYHGGYGGQVKDMILGVYTGATLPDTRIAVTAQTPITKAAQWQTIDLINPVFVAGGNKIWLAWVFENNVDIHFQAGSPGHADSGQTWASGMPDPFGSSSMSSFDYSIYATYTAGGGPPDMNAPMPDPAQWASLPSALDHSTVFMMVVEGNDTSGVEYYFEETTGNPGASDSGWQQSLTYSDYGLSPDTQYTYRVKARDMSPNNNETAWSTSQSATTLELPTTCPAGDLDGNCRVDWFDLGIFTGQWLDDPGCVGYPNDCADLDGLDDGINLKDFAALADSWLIEGIILVINEVMASNNTTVADPQSQYDDWVEIYNSTDITIDIGGMYLADSGNIWQIPADRPNDTSIPPHGYLIIWADDNAGDTPGLHADFKLNADGDEVHLYAADGTSLIDSISFDEQVSDISYGRYPDASGDWFSMSEPTHGYANTIGMSGAVYFSRPGGTFTSTFDLGLTTESQTADIYYTLDGSEPTDMTGTLYTTEFSISQTKWVRARAYEAGLVAGPVTSNSYIKLDPDVADFNSNLPIVVIDTFGYDIDAEWVSETRPFRPVISAFIDTDQVTGRTAITDQAQYDGYGGMHVRGNSTAEYDKKQYRFETWDEYGQDENVSLLGLPSESDWIIHGPFSDKTLMRNYQIYTWSNLIGRYASRTLFIEVFIDQDGDGVIEWDTGLEGSDTDYRGVYVLMEKIKRDDDRVDIARLEPTDVAEPEITGGYMLKKDWGGDGFTTTTYDDFLIYWDPEFDELTTAQKIWVEAHFNAFEAALAGSDFDNPFHVDYYGNYIDILSFIDHHILVEFGKNVDGFLLSTFLYKERNGKINMGPIWDYNGALGGADYICDWDPVGWLYEADDGICCPAEVCCVQDSCWRYKGGCEGDELPNHYSWYERLFQDPEFLLKYADRWSELRENLFVTVKMLADIDYNAALLTDSGAPDSPVNRNFTRWDTLDSDLWPNYYDNCHTSGNTYTDYVNWLRDWVSGRLTWMDSAVDVEYGAVPPVIKLNGSDANQGGYANVGDSVTITGGATIYYTTDGSDPREHGGVISGSASLYSPSITLNGTTQIKARIKSGSDWSALNEATFSVGPVAENLRITELMYHPKDTNDPNDPNAEFIELKNVGGTTINLNLVSFTDGIDFTFPNIALDSNDYVVVVRDPNVFASHYPSFSGTIAGRYSARLSNAGERIQLADALGQTILNFSFKDGWYHITDGEGFSLNIIDAANPDPNTWEYKQYWQSSSVVGGTPGDNDTGHVAAPGDVVINEVLTHTDDLVYGDRIELHNTTVSTINIAGWFLSDNPGNLKKYEIQPGDPRASVPLGGHVVFNSVDDFRDLADPGCHVEFGLSELGETVYLSSGSAGELTGGYCEKEDFKAAERDVSFGRYTKSPASANDIDFVAMQYGTFGTTNTDPNVGPVVISEIMYHPVTNTYAEYVELRNITSGTVQLYDPAYPANTWQLTDENGGIEYYLPAGTTIDPNGYLLLVKNKTAFDSEGYPAVPGTVQILEWVAGRLSNAGEKIQISKPGTPEPGTGFVPYIRVDRVNYSDGNHPENFYGLPADPWPTTPDGGGQSLHRIVLGDYGNDVANWQAASPSPGQ